MTNFLFWNINRKPLGGLISTLAQQHDVDVIILAESGIEPMRLRGLNSLPVLAFPSGCSPVLGTSLSETWLTALGILSVN